MTDKVNVCIAGATGAVGRMLLKVLEERRFPVNRLYPLASSRSAGTRVTFRGEEIEVLDMAAFDFSRAAIGLFSAGGSVSAVYAPKAAQQGCVVIDNTSHFRMHDNIPLVVPELNAQCIADYSNEGIIANPNCSTMQMVVALKPIYEAVGISRIDVATYQAVSGSGKRGIEELTQQSRAVLQGSQVTPEVFPFPIAFNCIPQVDVFEPNGYTREEMKMVNETHKIFADPDIVVNPTAVRVPVFCGHSEAVRLQTRSPISAERARDMLARAAGVELIDSDEKRYPTVLDCEDSDSVFVGRVRQDLSDERGLNMWIVSSNIRKGAASNAVQIAEILAQRYL